MTDVTYSRAVELLEAEVGDELVTLDPDRGQCFGFNNVATAVWRRLEQPRSFTDLRAFLLGEYDVLEQQCSDELEELLEKLAERGLVRRSAATE